MRKQRKNPVSDGIDPMSAAVGGAVGFGLAWWLTPAPSAIVPARYALPAGDVAQAYARDGGSIVTTAADSAHNNNTLALTYFGMPVLDAMTVLDGKNIPLSRSQMMSWPRPLPDVINYGMGLVSFFAAEIAGTVGAKPTMIAVGNTKPVPGYRFSTSVVAIVGDLERPFQGLSRLTGARVEVQRNVVLAIVQGGALQWQDAISKWIPANTAPPIARVAPPAVRDDHDSTASGACPPCPACDGTGEAAGFIPVGGNQPTPTMSTKIYAPRYRNANTQTPQ